MLIFYHFCWCAKCVHNKKSKKNTAFTTDFEQNAGDFNTVQNEQINGVSQLAIVSICSFLARHCCKTFKAGTIVVQSGQMWSITSLLCVEDEEEVVLPVGAKQQFWATRHLWR